MPQLTLPPSFQPIAAGLLARPLATSILRSSLWNTSNPASSAALWLNFTCGVSSGNSSNSGNTSSSNTAGAGSAWGCGGMEEECRQQLMHEISQGRYWAAIVFPSNFSAAYLSWFQPATAGGVYVISAP